MVPLCPLLGEVEQARIAAALYVDETCSESLVVARLRDELFQLEVRERNAVMNAAILQDLEGADAALGEHVMHCRAFFITSTSSRYVDSDLKIVDVEVRMRLRCHN